MFVERDKFFGRVFVVDVRGLKEEGFGRLRQELISRLGSGFFIWVSGGTLNRFDVSSFGDDIFLRFGNNFVRMVGCLVRYIFDAGVGVVIVSEDEAFLALIRDGEGRVVRVYRNGELWDGQRVRDILGVDLGRAQLLAAVRRVLGVGAESLSESVRLLINYLGDPRMYLQPVVVGELVYDFLNELRIDESMFHRLMEEASRLDMYGVSGLLSDEDLRSIFMFGRGPLRFILRNKAFLSCRRCGGDCVPVLPSIDGSPSVVDVVVVGESAGEEEVRLGRPFVGRSGELLNNWLRIMGVGRERCLITNTVLCKPGSIVKMERRCAARVLEDLRDFAGVKVKIALGVVAARNVIGRNVSVMGFYDSVHEGVGRVLFLYHPAFFLRKGSAQKLDAVVGFLKEVRNELGA
ncbi:MAG: uracil-DNA glycosylase family protein [Candidatus Freyarchaeota archaeon]|nr:uracil-DNA glycosylase family protein [Candidatus Jordarchaeia archaeon]